MNKNNPTLSFVKDLYTIWITERPTTFAAALAYYGIFSFAPIIFIVFTIAGIFINTQDLVYKLTKWVSNTMGSEAAQFVQDSITALSQKTSGGTTITTIIGFLVLFFAASMMFFQIQYALNTLWLVPKGSKKTVFALVRGRLMAWLMLLGLAILVILAGIGNIIISLFRTTLNLETSITYGSMVLFIGLLIISVTLIFKVLPDARIAWRDAWIGGFVTAVLIALGFVFLKIYWSFSKINSALDAAGAVAVFLFTFYIIAQLFLFGAVFTRVYANRYGSKILPATPAE